MGFLGGIGSALGNLFQGGAKTIGNIGSAIGSGLQSFGQSGAFGGGGGGFGNLSTPSLPAQGGNQMSFGGGGGITDYLKQPSTMLGLGTLFGSQFIGNQKPPALPDSFNQFQQQANAGGPQIMQQANQYNQGILNGTNTDAQDAATHSLDLNYQEQLRQLQGMYKSLRPGTDPTSDTTYQRDLNNLNDMYTRQRAQTLAQQQQGAAQYGLQAGGEQANQQAQAIQTQVSQQNAQWQAQLQKQAALRNMLMSIGGGNLGMNSGFGALANLFKGGQQ